MQSPTPRLQIFFTIYVYQQTFNPELTQLFINDGVFIPLKSTITVEAGTPIFLNAKLYHSKQNVAPCQEYIANYENYLQFFFFQIDTWRLEPRILECSCNNENLQIKIQLSSDMKIPPVLAFSQMESDKAEEMLYFNVRATKISPQLSGVAEFNIDYVKQQTPNAVSPKKDKILSETIFVIPFALVDEYGNFVRQACNVNQFDVESDLIIEKIGAAFNEQSGLCDIFAKVQLNGFSTNVQIGASYQGETFGGGLNYQRYFREIYPSYPQQVFSQIQYKIQKKEQWVVIMNICFGAGCIVAGVIWFFAFFEKKRRHVM